ncbi:hypothetical protein H310_11357 [Aphanomyces invadans]|uniref:Uncharacterized protein n=1 Tax=Aphanomyces invadans TaxID=157072 RepID=A0A024TM06_9STRA|nr:hypothetical protein H310_11357 [Aphanomyces invadans]ETV95063.1 hypothetical protein H310_11357 [Aphanomyces invadans]|eukprot:XP_008876236.1 hypothetical protein H310_11357 [Aphanomyces invadans]
MSATPRLRNLTIGNDLAGVRTLIVVLAVLVVGLILYGAYQTKRATNILRQRRESTADTSVDDTLLRGALDQVDLR